MPVGRHVCATCVTSTTFPLRRLTNIWTDTRSGSSATDKIYVVQTNSKVIERCLLMTTDPGDLVLDPTCGSGTTAYVAEQWGRRWITCDTSRVALALARTRLMAAQVSRTTCSPTRPKASRRKPSSPARSRRDYKTDNDIRKGFVYKRVPHVTLKSHRQQPGHQGRHDARGDRRRHRPPRRHRDALRPAVRGQQAHPRHAGRSPSRACRRIACCRPTTSGRTARASEREARPAAGQFATMILDNLRKAGVQNTRKNERLDVRPARAATPGRGFTPTASTPTPTARRGASPSPSAPSTAPSARSR